MSLRVATYNLRNFFDDQRAESDPQAKADWVSQAIGALEADVVALQEIGSESAMRRVVAALTDRGLEYEETVFGTPDERGIRCGLISRLPIMRSRVVSRDALDFPVFVDGDPSPFGARIPLKRGLVVVICDAGAVGQVAFVVAHFKSRRPVPIRRRDGESIPAGVTTAAGRVRDQVRSDTWRLAEALLVRETVDEVLEQLGSGNVMVLGDLNDVPNSPVLRAIAGRGGTHALIDLVEARVGAGAISILHAGGGLRLDHALGSDAIAKRVRGVEVRSEGLMDIADLERLRLPDSDHAPVVVELDA